MSLRIKDLRTERHLTQQDVADGTSISRSVLSQYEAGTVDPTASVLSRLAEYFKSRSTTLSAERMISVISLCLLKACHRRRSGSCSLFFGR